MLGAARHPAHLFPSVVLHTHCRIFRRSAVHRYLCANLVLSTGHGRNPAGRCALCLGSSSHHRSLLAKTLPPHCCFQTPSIAVLTTRSRRTAPPPLNSSVRHRDSHDRNVWPLGGSPHSSHCAWLLGSRGVPRLVRGTFGSSFGPRHA